MNIKNFSSKRYCGRVFCYNVIFYDIVCSLGDFQYCIELGLCPVSYVLSNVRLSDSDKSLSVLRFFYLLEKSFPFFFIKSYFEKIGVQRRARKRVVELYNYYFDANSLMVRSYSYDFFSFFDFFRFFLYMYCCKRAQYVMLVRDKWLAGDFDYNERCSFLFYDSHVKELESRRFLSFYISLFSRMIEDVGVPFRFSTWLRISLAVGKSNLGFFKNVFGWTLGCGNKSFCLDHFFSFFGFVFLEKKDFFTKCKDYTFFQRMSF